MRIVAVVSTLLLFAAGASANGFLSSRQSSGATVTDLADQILDSLGLSSLGCTSSNSDISITSGSDGVPSVTVTGGCLSGTTPVQPAALVANASQRARTKRGRVDFRTWA
ncbi:hypothetical protein T439DRAFT_359894 [Meredithblackwellia eburnea MCA 4105]